MKKNSLLLVLLLATVSCGPSGSGGSGSTGSSSGSSGSGSSGVAESVVPTQAAVPGRDIDEQGVAFFKKPDYPTLAPVKVTPVERGTLKSAIAQADAAKSSHIHADAPNGQLVFSADKTGDDASHVTGKESEISLTQGGATKKVVATESAAQVLQSRAGH